MWEHRHLINTFYYFFLMKHHQEHYKERSLLILFWKQLYKLVHKYLVKSRLEELTDHSNGGVGNDSGTVKPVRG